MCNRQCHSAHGRDFMDSPFPFVRHFCNRTSEAVRATYWRCDRPSGGTSGTDCGGGSSFNAHTHAAAAGRPTIPSSPFSRSLAPFGLSLESLSFSLSLSPSLSLSRRSFFTPQIGHLSKERRRCGGASGRARETTALKGQPLRPRKTMAVGKSFGLRFGH